MRRAATGVLALFFAVHCITVAATAWGAPAFVRVTTAIGTTRASALGVVAFLAMLVDRAIHVREAMGANKSADTGNAGFAELVTGWVTIAWLAGQSWGGVYAVATRGAPPVYIYSSLMTRLSSTGMLGVPWVALGQVLATVAVAFFLLSRATSPFARRARTAVAIAGSIALLLPLNGLLYMATGSRVMGPSLLTLDVPAAPCGSAR